MKILHIVGGDLEGGAARGARWLHEALLGVDIESRILTNDSKKTHLYHEVYAKRGASVRRSIFCRLNQIQPFFYRNSVDRFFNTAQWGADVANYEIVEWADIVHIHWPNSGMLKIKSISSISKPLVWTLRDMWAFTGGCHYTLGCQRYFHSCGKCEVLGSSIDTDLSNKNILVKKNVNNRKKINYVAISRWLADEAKRSRVLEDNTVEVIPNCVDTEVFYPAEENVVNLGLPINKKLILIVAQNFSDEYKGFKYILASMSKFDVNNYCFVFAGSLDESLLDGIAENWVNVGVIRSDDIMRELYSSVDMLLVASQQEAFGKTIIESLACGTPVVAFDATGPRDIVLHKTNGYLAEPYSVDDLVIGISWVLESIDKSEKFVKSCRAYVTKMFSFESVAKRYVQLYKGILDEKG